MVAVNKQLASREDGHGVHRVSIAEDIPVCVASVLAAMSSERYSVSDGLAVQFAVSECLQALLANLTGSTLRMRYQVTADAVVVEVERIHESTRAASSTQSGSRDFSQPESADPQREVLTRAFASITGWVSSLTWDMNADRVQLTRRRGHTPTLPSPPAGYDFQI